MINCVYGPSVLYSEALGILCIGFNHNWRSLGYLLLKHGTNIQYQWTTSQKYETNHEQKQRFTQTSHRFLSKQIQTKYMREKSSLAITNWQIFPWQFFQNEDNPFKAKPRTHMDLNAQLPREIQFFLTNYNLKLYAPFNRFRILMLLTSSH